MLIKLKTKLQNLWNHAGFRRYFANTAWLFAGRAFQMVVGFLVGVWVARYLGPAKFGLLSFARSFVGLFMALSTLGLDPIVVRELVKDESKMDVLLGTSFFLKLIGATVAVTCASVAIYFTSTDTLTRLMVLIIAFSLIFQAFNVIDLYFQSKVISKFSVLAQIFSTILSAIVKIILILEHASLIYFAAAGVFDMITIGAGYIYFYYKTNNLPLNRWKFELSCAKILLKDSWPLILSGVAIGIYMKIDQVMIKYILNDRAVGLYSAAVRLCEVWYVIPAVITGSLFPAIINAKKISKKLYYERLQRLYSLMVWTAITISVIFSLTSNFLVKLLYGEAYVQSRNVLSIYIWITVFVFIGVAFSKYLIVEDYTQKALYRTSLGAIINIGLNLLLISKYGIVGAAYATLTAQFIANYGYDFLDSDLRKYIGLKLKCFNPYYIVK